jgi:L-cysteine:1D-myo-inositol 2-amino-2-deoxy-alpha-D-glucopyranoside ligase
MTSIFAERGGDPDRHSKKNPLDCLVWLSQRPNEPGWESPFSGRPGWHIECTAIAIEYLQPSETDQTLIDIQGGGSDLIFPHHEMCAAQAKVITGKELASHYVHAGMVGLDGEKMSKSKGNLVFVSRLISEGHDPMAIRWALMKSHYRSDRMWTEKILIDAEREYETFKQALKTGNIELDEEIIGRIVDFMADDLNTPSVLQLLNSSVGSMNKSSDEDLSELKNVLDLVLGLQF